MNINKRDFHRLWKKCSTTLDQNWANRLGRFVLLDGANLQVDSSYKKTMYWFGDNYASVLFAKAFLESNGHSFQLVQDKEMGGAYAVLTETVGPAD